MVGRRRRRRRRARRMEPARSCLVRREALLELGPKAGCLGHLLALGQLLLRALGGLRSLEALAGPHPLLPAPAIGECIEELSPNIEEVLGGGGGAALALEPVVLDEGIEGLADACERLALRDDVVACNRAERLHFVLEAWPVSVIVSRGDDREYALVTGRELMVDALQIGVQIVQKIRCRHAAERAVRQYARGLAVGARGRGLSEDLLDDVRKQGGRAVLGLDVAQHGKDLDAEAVGLAAVGSAIEIVADGKHQCEHLAELAAVLQNVTGRRNRRNLLLNVVHRLGERGLEQPALGPVLEEMHLAELQQELVRAGQRGLLAWLIIVRDDQSKLLGGRASVVERTQLLR
eukprot:m.22527 g.22527  ORF g.22527 m.22527 type:complete len:348 (+) comp3764_c0_seq1:225-1268(+)